MNYKERILHAREIIDSNREIIRKLSINKYKYINQVLSKSGIKELLFAVYSYVRERNFFIYRRKYVFFITTNNINKIRQRTTKSVSNRYINYLCCAGLINKQYQHLDNNGLLEYTRLTGVNINHLQSNQKKRPINHFYFRAYTEKELNRLEKRSRRLIENGITPGNLSFNRLMANNCEDIAKEVYPELSENIYEKKSREYKQIIAFISKKIEEKGYTTKKEIEDGSGVSATEIEKIFRIYKKDFGGSSTGDYWYKAPNNEDRKKYGYKGNKWIITKKE